ncbi:uncharacterized protein CTHT_0038310 [Thermochaetoides thermophila DSM 1495]|uniref:DAGKc domain-containing protein n=1 Tax=Chaetomium thermophilum (strain DSM 1495 / CBS 144.50 / IMI 039719) TaxID=759272 RepID=G0S8J5_CHATD|nr:hypothetical protein CTHT_0038310 [Thermochaetoides thermophila DSM 1495]EGS21955.1 hypothetical protein CTHT_0038310 [Thermochaetoides thermophila DSM 1495]
MSRLSKLVSRAFMRKRSKRQQQPSRADPSSPERESNDEMFISVDAPRFSTFHTPSSIGNGRLPLSTPSFDALGAISENEVVCILPPAAAKSSSEPYYTVYTLTESPVDHASGDGPSARKGPFTLQALHVPADQAPAYSSLLGQYLLTGEKAQRASLLSDDVEVDVIISTRSGLGLAREFYESVLKEILEALGRPLLEDEGKGGSKGHRITVTKDGNTIKEFAQGLGKAAADSTVKNKLVLLLSGDGGVVDMLNGLETSWLSQQSAKQAGEREQMTLSSPAVALLPLGTANALFHSLHKSLHQQAGSNGPSPLVLSLRTLLFGVPAALPTFRTEFSPGARLVAGPSEPTHAPTTAEDMHSSAAGTVQVGHLLGAIVASYGFHASLVWESDTPAYRKHGDKRFGMAAAELLREAHGYDAVVDIRRQQQLDTESIRLYHGAVADHRCSYVLTTLVSNLERTFTISPRGKPLDGQLRLVHFGDVGGDRTMEIMQAAYREGEHIGMQDVGYEPPAEDGTLEEVTVTVNEDDPRWRKVCVDGTIVELEQGGWMRVRREKGQWLRILVDRCVAEQTEKLRNAIGP